jgi:hypothetical protein
MLVFYYIQLSSCPVLSYECIYGRNGEREGSCIYMGTIRRRVRVVLEGDRESNNDPILTLCS